ncbi:MAG: hypothetical protein SPJ92_05960 [Bariatricus sp.]|nr:hypothetical protein [Bariatricus sp.]
MAEMYFKTIIDGNSVYEIDERCLQKKRQAEQQEEKKRTIQRSLNAGKRIREKHDILR